MPSLPFSTHLPPVRLVRPLLAILALTGSVSAQAVPITYTFNGLASGNFVSLAGGSSSFSGSALTVTINTDTTNINTVRFGANTPATASLVPGSISIAGVGSGSFNNLLYVFNNQNLQVVGFGASNDLINLSNSGAGLATYGLTTNFGPMPGIPPNFVSQFNNVGVSFGTLTLTQLNNATFQAAVVPEPETWALMVAGLAWVAVRARRRTA